MVYSSSSPPVIPTLLTMSSVFITVLGKQVPVNVRAGTFSTSEFFYRLCKIKKKNSFTLPQAPMKMNFNIYLLFFLCIFF